MDRYLYIRDCVNFLLVDHIFIMRFVYILRISKDRKINMRVLGHETREWFSEKIVIWIKDVVFSLILPFINLIII